MLQQQARYLRFNEQFVKLSGDERKHPSPNEPGVEKKRRRPLGQSKRANIPGTQADNVASIAKSG